MATLTRYSDAIVNHFAYSNANPPALEDAQIISAYVYDPGNSLVYSVPNGAIPTGNTGITQFFLPGVLFTLPTKPETYFTLVTRAQFPDGRISGNAETISVI